MACRVTYKGKVFFKDDFINMMLDTMRLSDAEIKASKYLSEKGYKNIFEIGKNDPLGLLKKSESKSPEIPVDLEEKGIPVSNMVEAEKLQGDGYRMFVQHEQHEVPIEVFNVSDLKGYQPDQILAYPESKSPEIPGTPITEGVPTTPIKEPDIKPKVEGSKRMAKAVSRRVAVEHAGYEGPKRVIGANENTLEIDGYGTLPTSAFINILVENGRLPKESLKNRHIQLTDEYATKLLNENPDLFPEKVKSTATPPGEEGGIKSTPNGKETNQKGVEKGLLNTPEPDQQGAVTPLKEVNGRDVEARKKEIKSENDKLIKRKRELANDRDDVVTSEGKYKNFGKKERDARLEEIRSEVRDIDSKQESLLKELKVIDAKERGSVELFDNYANHGSTNTILYDIKRNKLYERENIAKGKTKEISIKDAAKQKFEKTQRGVNQKEINESYTDKVKSKYEAEITDEIARYTEKTPIKEQSLSEPKADTTPPKSDTNPPKTSLELAKEKLRLAKERAAKLRDNTNLGTTIDPFEKTKQQAIADREVLDGYIGLAKEYIKEGIKTVEEFAKAIGEKVEDVKKAWDFAEKGEVYGIKVDMLDEAVKDALHDKGDRRKFDEVETEARRKVAVGEIRPEEMINKINSGEKYLPNGEDIIALIDHKVNLEKQRSEIKKRFDEAQDQGVKNKIQGELDVVNDKLFQWDEMAIRTAADQSQAFRFRQLMRDNEFNAVKAIRDWKAEDKNGTIPAEMEAKIKEWAEKFKTLNEELAKKDQELTLEKEGRAEDNMKAEAERLKNKTAPAKKSSLSPEKAQRLNELAPKFKGRFLTGEKILTDFFDAEWREYAKLTFEEMAGDFKLFSKAIISNVGKKIAPFLREIYKEVGGTDEGIYGASKPFLNKKGELEVPHSLIRALVESGVEKIEDITKAVHAMVKDEFPGIGETKVRDTITKYGITRNPNPDVIEGKIALAKRIGRKLSSVERLKALKPPLKSGLIPVDITPIERQLNREIRNRQKLLPKTQEEIAKVWKTAVERTKTRLEHQIEDLTIAIDTATKMVKADGKATPDTPEINQLRDRKSALQKVYDEKFGKNAHELTDAERVERAINALEKESKNIAKDIKNGETAYKNTKSLPVNEALKKARERNKLIKEVLADLRKEEGLAAAKEMEMRKDANVRYILKQRERIKNKEFDPKPKKAFAKDEELLNILVQRRKVKQEWETAREKHRMEQRTLAEQWYETWRDIWGGTKSAITSLDVSAAGRQGLPLSIANPSMAKKAMKLQFEHMFSQEASDRWLAELQNKPIYQLMKDAKLYISEPTSKLLAKEESFASNFAEKIPWVKPSERAYVGYLNSIRTDVFEKMVGVLEDQGKTWEKNPQAFKDAAKFINDLTGRGPLNENAAKVLSDPILGMFSPRYVASRFSFFNPKNYLNPKIDPVVRQERIKSTVKFMGAVAAVLALAKYSGVADVNLDPTNTDFLKIKIGNKRIDILAGYSQVFGFMAKMVAEAYKQIKYRQTGIKPEDGVNEEGAGERLWNFYRGKMTPIGSAGADLYMGEDITRDKVSVAGEAAGLVTPLVVRDIYDLYKKEGAGWSAGLAIPLLFGIPTTSYGTTDKIWEVAEISPEENKVNVLGEQIDPKAYESNKGKEISDVWKFLDKYGGRPTFPKKSDLNLKDENGKNRAPTNEESYNYIVRSGEFIKEELKDLMDNGRKDENSEYTDEETGETKYTYTDISLLTPEEQKKEIKKAITRGKERAKKDLFEEKKTVLVPE